MSDVRQDLTRTTLAVVFIFVLIAASFWVLRPFLLATVWATMLVVATWPALTSLRRREKSGRLRGAAAAGLGGRPAACRRKGIGKLEATG